MNARTLLIALFMLPVASLWAQDDLVEFQNVEQAMDFGWISSVDAPLQPAEGPVVGKFALHAPGVDGREYQGVRLRRDIDLTGAQPNDVMVLYIKQNATGSVCVNLRVGEGHVHRYVATKRGEWTRLELDLDLAKWENPNDIEWGVVQTMSIYTRGFDSADEYLAIDGLSATVNGMVVYVDQAAANPTEWTFPQETDAVWLLGDDTAAWAIDKTTGRVTGAWNVRTRHRYANGAVGRYYVEDNKSLVTGVETADVVAAADFDSQTQTLILLCANDALPGIAIEKQYTLDGNRLARRVGFTPAERDDRFVTYNCEVALTPWYRDGGYYMHGLSTLIPAPNVASTSRSHRGSPKMMLLHQPKAGYGFAHFRTHTNDKFVWPFFTGSIAGFLERMNVLSYTPAGWDMSMGTIPLRSASQASYREVFTIFLGTWFDFFDREYRSLEPVQQTLADIPPTPDWVGDIVLYTGLPDMPHIERLVEMTDEGNIVVLISRWLSWADYYVDEGLVGQNGGFMDGPELKDLVARLHALSPRVKVCIYNLLWSATHEARIVAEHPTWFRYRNKEGQPLSFFPGCAPNFASLLSIEDCYNELLRQCELQYEYLDVDLLYLDIGCAVNLVDWETGEYNEDELCFRFFRDMKRIAAEQGPDKAIFFNGRGPWVDIAFTEARGKLRAGYWRHYAGTALGMETFGTYRPATRIIPLYWIDSLARDYVNRTLMMGWIPSLEYGNPVFRRPFAEAAYEFGNADPVPARITPDWKQDPDTKLESYVFQRRGDRGYVLSLVDHVDQPRTVDVTVNLADLDLDRDGLVYVIDHAVADASVFKGTVTTPIARRDYHDSGWRHDIVTQRRLLHVGPSTDALTLNIDMQPLLLRQFYITDQPLAVFSHGDLPANYLFGTSRGVRITTRVDTMARVVGAKIVCERDSAEVIALPPDDWSFWSVRLDGEIIEPKWTYECGRLCPIIEVTRGEHVIELFGGDELDAIAVRDFTAKVRGNQIELSVAGLATVERDGRIIAGGVGDALSIAPVRVGGEYTITLRGVIRDGRAVPVEPVVTTITLTDAPLKLPSDEPPSSDPSLVINDVNRTINGVRVLRSATYESAAVMYGYQPNLPGLTASIDPDTLSAQAGTTRSVTSFTGAAAAGLELDNVRQVQVQLDNSFYGNFSLRERGRHITIYRRTSREFAGFVVDYHTPDGYTKRVLLSVGVLHRECSTANPPYGRDARADLKLELGDLLNESKSKTFAIDLAKYAPDDWDGRVWLNVATDWVASDRRLTMRILAVNDAVDAPILHGQDPNAVRRLFEQPKRIDVPRAPVSPVIDGVPDEEMWKAAAEIDRFFLIGGEAFPQSTTTVRMFYDEKNLYVAFLLRDADRDKPILNYGSIWQDDEVELWLDVDSDGKSYHQLIVNGAGASLELQPDGEQPFGATAAAHMAGDGLWYVEAAVPFDGLGIETPKPGDTWQINFARNRPPGDKVGAELITWGPLEAAFKELNHFGTATFR